MVAGAAFVLLSVAFTVPVAWNLGTRVPTGEYTVDPLHVLYGFAWGARSLVSHPLAYFDAGFFYPYPMSLTFLDQLLGLCLLGAPVIALTGNAIVAYNVVWLLTFALSGFGAFLLVRHLTGSGPGGFLAGVLFAFHPFRYHNAGLIQAEAMMWIPFALLALHRWFGSGRRRHLVLFFLFACLQFLSNGYSAVFLEIAAGLYMLVRLLDDRRTTLERLGRDRWVLVAAAVACGIVMLPFAAPVFHNAGLDGKDTRTLGAAALFSAVPVDFLTPAPNGLLPRFLTGLGTPRHPLFPGVVALFLSLALVLVRGWKGNAARAGEAAPRAEGTSLGAEIVFYLLLAGAAAVLALGPFFTVDGHRIPLPFAAVHAFVPGGAFLRAPARFALLGSLAVAVLAGVALSRILSGRKGKGKGVVAVLVIAAAAAELCAAPVRLLDPYPDGIPSVYERLRAIPEPVVIAELPMPPDELAEREEHVRYQLYSLYHGKRLVNGVAASVPPITRRLRTAMQGFPDPSSVSMLQELGVDLVLLHTDRLPPEAVKRMRTAVGSRPDLVLVDAATPIWMIEVPPRRGGV
jgi:hypothetical protein